MNRMIIKSRIGKDGVLHMNVPVSPADADREVQIIIEPVESAAMTPEEWRNFILATAGSITDPTFVRHEQGEFEDREHSARLPAVCGRGVVDAGTRESEGLVRALGGRARFLFCVCRGAVQSISIHMHPIPATARRQGRQV
jgi:hypothetical protein